MFGQHRLCEKPSSLVRASSALPQLENVQSSPTEKAEHAATALAAPAAECQKSCSTTLRPRALGKSKSLISSHRVFQQGADNSLSHKSIHLQDCWTHLQHSEASYIDGLELLSQICSMLLQQQETARVCRLQSVVGRLAKVHKVFLSQLSEEQSLPTAIAEIFLETSDILDIHDEYRESVIAATDLLSSLPEDTCQMLASAIPSLAEQSMEDVSALFHASFSRLEEYLQCFENTACRTTEESQIVSSACCKIRERLLGLVSQGDWCLPSAENGVRSLNRDVVHISKCVTHLPPYVNIAVPGRVIYKQGLLTKQKLSSHKFSRIAKSKKERMCFLFNDMLISVWVSCNKDEVCDRIFKASWTRRIAHCRRYKWK